MARKAQPKPMLIQFSRNPFDQWRLSKVGGSIYFDPKGREHFKFETFDDYQQYLSLGRLRMQFEVNPIDFINQYASVNATEILQQCV